MDFPDLLRLIDERATAFRTAVAAAPTLDAPVPTCPGWTLADLVTHLANGRRKWASIIAAGPADAPPPQPSEPADLTEATQQLLEALREAGPDRGCWGWWEDSQSPLTAGAAARHQVQEIAVHTYDAQLTIGAPQPLPTAVALDGIEDFLLTCCATTSPWPHTPATVDYQTTEGPGWRLHLSTDGARAERLPASGPASASATATAAASDLELILYGRLPVTTAKLNGDSTIFDQLIAWDPSA
ncbi:maleylpyruvate isomerase family mycothiol-dependent enzyme [Paractinoplanes atraurantiacus]|uniref:TIGR03083 family protein n=1 Tax=Paractinoplanes atraurantiacus TaxID=1036182 RepID=A0A285K454_9ACTN|nr:maleylpyruvate isomerase family mycothiol-dependent enzyme [Actinoplanes atraurantiacus]SNY67370.1 TIGR03083 family protein [Actinoplanes atraurantiacus]